MCQAPGGPVYASSRVYAQIWAPAGRRPWPWRQEPPGVSLLIAPKVHFLNTDLEKECPLRLSVRTTPPRPVHWMRHVPAARAHPVLLRR